MRKQIEIFRECNKVVAKDILTGKTGVAKCSPEDKFDFMTGAKLALERLSKQFSKPKFKVGDRVIANDLATKKYLVTKKGWVGVVTCAHSEDGFFSATGAIDGLYFDYLCEDRFDLANDLILPGDEVVVESLSESLFTDDVKIKHLTGLRLNVEQLARFDFDFNHAGLMELKRRGTRCTVIAVNKSVALISQSCSGNKVTYLIGVKSLARCRKEEDLI